MSVAVAEPAYATDFAVARRAMIDSQLRTSGVIDDAVLGRMGTLPREDFVPDAMRAVAYMDRAVPLGDGRSLPSPLFHALLLQEAGLSSADRVLIVDCGAGYLPALVEPLVASCSVVSPEDAVSDDAGDDQGDGAASLLLIDGAVAHLPTALLGRLGTDARVVCGIVEGGVTRLVVGRKAGDRVALNPVQDLGIPVLGQFAPKKAWRF